MFKTGFDIISEACKAENCETSSTVDSAIEDELAELYDEDDEESIDELDEVDEAGLRYTAEMVPVVESRGRYFVELSVLSRFANDANISIPDALYEVANACTIEASKVSVVVESNEECSSYIEAGKAQKRAKLKDFRTAIKDLKNEKIDVKKKKSKFSASNPFKSKKKKSR